jgi:tetratricopeptide (TPR) repeat protein
MNKDFKIFALIALAAIIYFGLHYYNSESPNEKIDSMLASARKTFGNNKVFFGPNDIEYKIDSLIEKEKYPEALALIDTAGISENLRMDYKGQILLNQGKPRESIYWFNQAIALVGAYSKSVPHRAKAYEALGIYDSAILDYKKIADINFDFYRPIAEVYDKMKLKDSALKYYKLFLEEYPDSNSVKIRIEHLEKSDANKKISSR